MQWLNCLFYSLLIFCKYRTSFLQQSFCISRILTKALIHKSGFGQIGCRGLEYKFAIGCLIFVFSVMKDFITSKIEIRPWMFQNLILQKICLFPLTFYCFLKKGWVNWLFLSVLIFCKYHTLFLIFASTKHLHLPHKSKASIQNHILANLLQIFEIWSSNRMSDLHFASDVGYSDYIRFEIEIKTWFYSNLCCNQAVLKYHWATESMEVSLDRLNAVVWWCTKTALGTALRSSWNVSRLEAGVSPSTAFSRAFGTPD